jgi:methylated-DNA-[protein]-cysteine S-methyltransferase
VMLESMNQKVIALLQYKNKYVAGVFTSKGLYATSLPHTSRDEAIKSVNGFNLPDATTSKNLQFLEIVFDICDGVKNNEINQDSLDFSDLTPKQVAVLKTTMKIPYGSTWSYGLVAKRAGLPRAARFVGNVMAHNRFAPIVPCHRVVSATGLGGYTGGLDLKVSLLSKEGAFAD